MDTSNPLAELKDLHLPTEVPLFPLAIGWYLIAAILVLAIIGFIYYRICQRKRLAKILAIEQLITELESNHTQLIDAEIIAQASILLKRIAMTKFPTQKPEYLTGMAWLEFLDKTGKTTKFSTGVGKCLINIYQLQQLNNRDEFFNLLRKWLRSVL
ncbi:MAG: DUF4381 domain-containing protein [Proteobacteria bacterium]|nr:MAG: DUF4381 domain-containing protein [Pseudomonadota bacterium]